MNTVRVMAVCTVWLRLQGCASSRGANGERVSETDAAVANMNLGAGYLRQGRADLAIERLQRALTQNPRLADAHTFLAIAYDQSGALTEAEEHYKRATQLESGNPAAANSYAVFLCRQNRWREAEPYFRRAADNPRYSTPEAPLANAGVCARNAGDVEKAEEYLRAALSKNPTYADALSSMMELSYQKENYLQARAFVQRYLEARPASASVLWMCFNIEQALENRDSADRCAAQLRAGFQGSVELARLEELQRTR
jgi:type IV pilus assembly protein PilF